MKGIEYGGKAITMKFHITDEGDSSVGILPNEAEMEIKGMTSEDLNPRRNDREDLRDAIAEFFREELCFECGRVKVVIEDECEECLQLLGEDGKCHNEGCPSSEEFHRE